MAHAMSGLCQGITRSTRGRVPWASLEQRYVTDPDLTLDQLAEEIGVNPRTVYRQSAKRQWVSKRAEQQERNLEHAKTAVAKQFALFAVQRQAALMALLGRGVKQCIDRMDPRSKEAKVFGLLRMTPFDLVALSKHINENETGSESGLGLPQMIFEHLPPEEVEAIRRGLGLESSLDGSTQTDSSGSSSGLVASTTAPTPYSPGRETT